MSTSAQVKPAMTSIDQREWTAIPGVRGDILQWLPEPVRRHFQAQSVVRSMPAGQTIFQYGESGKEMFRILRGTVRVSMMRIDGLQMVYGLLGPGECLGAGSLADGEPMPQTAEALDNVGLQVLSVAGFTKLRREHRVFDDALIRHLSIRLRMFSAHMANAVLADLPSRVALRLLEVARVGLRGEVTVSLTQASLASLTGTSRQTMNKILKQLENDGLIHQSYRVIQLKDIGRLKRMSEIV
jgi:CRP/FNR family transcriptional regulator, cyclic AMP receptor protein